VKKWYLFGTIRKNGISLALSVDSLLEERFLALPVNQSYFHQWVRSQISVF